MDYYNDITILLNPELPVPVLMNSLFSKLHKALYDLNSKEIGVSFPNYKLTLGNVLRIHGSKEELTNLNPAAWIGSLVGYCKIQCIQQVPTETKYRIISRKQATLSQSKLRRLIKRGSIKESNIERYEDKISSKELSNPYLELTSNSNGKRHRRYIDFGPLLDSPVVGLFDFFGLSMKATIPWF